MLEVLRHADQAEGVPFAIELLRRGGAEEKGEDRETERRQAHHEFYLLGSVAAACHPPLGLNWA